MPDREKVIKAWEIFRESNPYEICSEREFRAIREPEYCMGQMIADTIALLKEQEAVKPTWRQRKAYCGSCGKRIPLKISARFCHKCGKAVKWG